MFNKYHIFKQIGIILRNGSNNSSSGAVAVDICLDLCGENGDGDGGMQDEAWQGVIKGE